MQSHTQTAAERQPCFHSKLIFLVFIFICVSEIFHTATYFSQVSPTVGKEPSPSSLALGSFPIGQKEKSGPRFVH